jgi:hypothetical protein
MVTSQGNGDLKVGRFQAGQDTQFETCSTELDQLIRTIVKLGGGYSEVIQCLQEARAAGCLEARLAVEALPRPNRRFYRDDDPLPEAPAEEPGQAEPGTSATASAAPASEGQIERRAATPAPELFTDGLEAGRARQQAQEESRAPAGEPYVAPSYQSKPGFFDKLNPFGGQSSRADGGQ